MFGNQMMRAVAAQNRDTTALDDGTNVKIVEIPTQEAARQRLSRQRSKCFNATCR